MNLVHRHVFNPTQNHNQVAFTLGGNAYDLFYHDTRTNVEYTRINPWVYNHQYVEDTYQNHGVNLGDWIGQNADLFSVSVYHRPMYNLEIGLQFQSLRKGGKESTKYQYRRWRIRHYCMVRSLSSNRSELSELISLYAISLSIFTRSEHGFTTAMTASTTDNTVNPGYNEYLNNPFDYVLDPSYAGKYDVSIGIRYNVY